MADSEIIPHDRLFQKLFPVTGADRFGFLSAEFLPDLFRHLFERLFHCGMKFRHPDEIEAFRRFDRTENITAFCRFQNFPEFRTQFIPFDGADGAALRGVRTFGVLFRDPGKRTAVRVFQHGGKILPTAGRDKLRSVHIVLDAVKMLGAQFQVSLHSGVQAVGAGSAIVTAKAGEQTATCQVTVEEAAQPDTPVTPTVKELVLQSIYGSKGDISIGVGEKAPMKVMGTESAVTWSMENAAVATVDESGAVTGVASGKTTLTATVDGQTLYCTIRVR